MNRLTRYRTAALACCCAVGLAHISVGLSADRDTRVLPEWSEGDWWETLATRIAQPERDGTEWPEGRLRETCESRCRWVFVGVKDVSMRYLSGPSVRCDVIEVFAVSMPRDMKRGTPADPIARLHLRHDTGTCYILDSLDWRACPDTADETSWEIREKKTHYALEEDAPLEFGGNRAVPLDVPKFPCALGDMHPLPARLKTKAYPNEFGTGALRQGIVVLDCLSWGRMERNIIVTLIVGKAEIVTMRWVPGLPWWAEMRCVRADGTLPQSRFLRARLVAFGKKGDKGIVVPPIDSDQPIQPTQRK